MLDLAEEIERFNDDEWDTLAFMIRCRVTRKIARLLNALPVAPSGQWTHTDRLAGAMSKVDDLRRERVIRSAREAQKQKILGWEVYSPAMLKRFLEWDGDTCAFPLCEERDFLRNTWHLCPMHSNRFSIAMSQRKTRAGITRERICYGVSGTTN